MKSAWATALFLALAVLSQGRAHGPAAHNTQATLDTASTKPKVASLVGYAPRLSPPLTDSKSDKKFFGPNGDYTNDNRPVVDKSILNKLKSPDQPYPALQAKDEYDRDFVKDENSDKGHWNAQFEYDSLRRKLRKEALDGKAAGDAADAAGAKEDAARKKVDEADKGVNDAAKDVDAAKGELGAGKDDADVGAPSAEELEKLKKKVSEAEAAYEKEKADFEGCEKALAEAKKNVEELKAKQVEMEGQLAAETKFWEEQKTVRLNLRKVKVEAAAAKREEALTRLAAANKVKAEKDEQLANKKQRREEAQKDLQKEKTKLDLLHKHLEAAALTLQTIQGYKPAPVKTEVKKSWFWSLMR